MKILKMLCIVVTIGMLVNPVYAVTAPQIPASLPSRNFDIEVHIVVDSTWDEQFDLGSILDGRWTDGFTSGDLPYGTLTQVSFSYSTLTEAQHNNLVTYLDSIANKTGPNGHTLNSSAYEDDYQVEFNEASGIAIDADATLDWIIDNLWDGVENRYALFFLNLTEFDIGGEQHWFRTFSRDLDTNEPEYGFYSGGYGLVHGKSVAAWGGKPNYPVHFIDPSSTTWYGDFINTVWGEYGWRDTTLSKTLSDFDGVQDPNFNNWVGNWVGDFVERLYNVDLFDSTSIVEDIYMDTIVYSNWTRVGKSVEDNQWIISDTKITNELDQSFSWIDFNVNIEWNELQDHAELYEYVQDQIEYDIIKQRYVINIEYGLLDYIEENIISQYLGEPNRLPSVVFLLDDVVFQISGIAIAGVSYNGWQLQGMKPEKAYYEDDTPRGGLSETLIHEIGHSLGFPHPFYNYDHWSSDFTASVMGYYSGWDHFSIYEHNALGLLYSNYFLLQAEYLDFLDLTSEEYDYTPAKHALIDAIIAQEQWRYEEAISKAKLAIDLFIDPPEISEETTEQGNQSTSTSTTSPLDTNLLPVVVALFSPMILIRRRKRRQLC